MPQQLIPAFPDAETAIERLSSHGESAAAHLGFLDYVYMPPNERSLRALHKRYESRQRDGAKPPTTQLATLFSWSSKYFWAERTAAYDDDQRRKRIAAEEAERVAMNKRHKQMAQAVQAKVLQWLKDAENGFDKPQDVLAALKVATELERKAMGVPDSLLQLTTMTTDELLARYADLARRVAGAPLPDSPPGLTGPDILDSEG